MGLEDALEKLAELDKHEIRRRLDALSEEQRLLRLLLRAKHFDLECNNRDDKRASSVSNQDSAAPEDES